MILAIASLILLVTAPPLFLVALLGGCYVIDYRNDMRLRRYLREIRAQLEDRPVSYGHDERCRSDTIRRRREMSRGRA